MKHLTPEIFLPYSNLWKIWRSAPSGTGSYSRQAGRQAGR